MTDADTFRTIMERSADLKRRTGSLMADSAVAVVDACEASLRRGGKLIFCGNGGSAGDSMHLATEMLIRLRSHVERESWPAISLASDSTAILAAGNDYGFDRVFERPLRGLGRSGDILFGITTSSRSPNVLFALRAAREMGIVTIGLLGGTGKPASELCDHPLIVRDSETAFVQECHVAMGHAILQLLENRLVASPISRDRVIMQP